MEWNPYNRALLCHACGQPLVQVIAQVGALRVAPGLSEALGVMHEEPPHVLSLCELLAQLDGEHDHLTRQFGVFARMLLAYVRDGAAYVERLRARVADLGARMADLAARKGEPS